MVNPFAYEEYRKEKIRQKIEETRAQRVQLKVNNTAEFTQEGPCVIPKTPALLFICLLSLHLWYIVVTPPREARGDRVGLGSGLRGVSQGRAQAVHRRESPSAAVLVTTSLGLSVSSSGAK